MGSAFGSPARSGEVAVATDVTGPVGQLVANGGRTYVNDTTATASWSVLSDTPFEMRLGLSADEVLAAAWVPYAAQTTVQLLAGDGPRTVFGQLRDAAGNESAVVSAFVAVDTEPPSSSVSLAQSTSISRTVVLAIASADDSSGVEAVEIWSRQRPGPSDPWTAWTQGAVYTTDEITLEVEADGEFEFYTVAVDRAGNRENAPASADDSIVFDTVVPASSAGPLNASYTGGSVAVPFSANDAGSGVLEVRLWSRYRPSSGGAWTVWSMAATGSTSPISFPFSSGPGDYEFYTIAVDVAGNVEAAPGSADTATTNLPEISWGTAVRISAPSVTLPTGPRVGAGSDGAADAVWQQGTFGSEDIYTTHFDPAGGTWSAPVKLNSDTGTTAQTHPSIGASGVNNAVAVWEDDRSDSKSDIFAARRTSSGWGSNVKVNDDTKSAIQGSPAIDLDGSGKAVAVWYDTRSNKKAIRSATLATGSSTWSANLQVSTNTSQYKTEPDVAFGPDGTAYAVWGYDPGADFVDVDLYFAKLPSGASAWSPEVKVNDVLSQSSARPSIAVAADGSIMVVWSRTTTETRVSRSLNGGSTWTASSAAPVSMQYGRLSADESGTLFLTWGSSSVWMSRWEPADSTWSAPEVISDGPSAGSASLAATTSRLTVVWHDTRNGSNGEIYGRIGVKN